MIQLAPPLRLAVAADGPVLAALVNHAGEGLPLAIWRGLAAPGEDPWTIGTERQAQRAEAGQILVIDHGDGAVAGLTGYPIRAAEPVTEAMPAAFRPLQELENQAVGSWYVNVLAALPGQRGKGYGGTLLTVAEDIARAEALAAMSLIVADSNDGARRLYARHGYAETARAPAAPLAHWASPTREWRLMIKPLG